MPEESNGPVVSDADVESYREGGFVIKRGFYTRQETDLLSAVARAEMAHHERRPEIWDSIPFRQHDLGTHTIFNAMCFNKRLVNAFERLLIDGCGTEERWGRTRPDPLPRGLTLHHRKLIVKDRDNHESEADLGDNLLAADKPVGGGYRGGNRFLWHQDFWYWGNPDGTDAYGRAGRPFPDLATCFTAIDPATQENGCLELLRGSHKLGRVDFEVKPWGQRIPVSDQIEAALASGCEPVFCELDPGDAVFFNCEVLHQSAPNATDDPRWAFLVCFDPEHNAPIGVDDPRRPAPVWADNTILEYGEQHRAALRET